MTSLAFCRAISAHRRRASCRLLPVPAREAAASLSLPGEELASSAQTASAACSRRSTLARVSSPAGIWVRTG